MGANETMKTLPFIAALVIVSTVMLLLLLYRLQDEPADRETVIIDFVWVVGSVVVGTLFAIHLATRSSQELRNEASKLRHESEESRRLTTLILRGLEEGGILNLPRDDQGNITGLVIHGSGSARI